MRILEMFKKKLLILISFTYLSFPLLSNEIQLTNNMDENNHSIEYKNQTRNDWGILSSNGKNTVIQLRNKGGYRSFLRVRWISPLGEEVIRETSWIHIHQQRQIDVPANAKNVMASGVVDIGLSNESFWWSSFINQKLTIDIPKFDPNYDVNVVTYHMWGVAINPKWNLI